MTAEKIFKKKRKKEKKERKKKTANKVKFLTEHNISTATGTAMKRLLSLQHILL
jgi:hypothetical protein